MPADEWHKISESLTWEGVKIDVRYNPAYFGEGNWPQAHIAVHVVKNQRGGLLGRVIPLTDTGYRSHFCKPEEVDAAGGPAAFVRRLLDEAAQAPSWRRKADAARQGDLFAGLG